MRVKCYHSRLIKKITILLYLFYCFQAGIFLLMIPWLKAWEENYFLYQFEILRPILLSGYMRGAVSSLGMIHLLLGLSDTVYFFRKPEVKKS